MNMWIDKVKNVMYVTENNGHRVRGDPSPTRMDGTSFLCARARIHTPPFTWGNSNNYRILQLDVITSATSSS